MNHPNSSRRETWWRVSAVTGDGYSVVEMDYGDEPKEAFRLAKYLVSEALENPAGCTGGDPYSRAHFDFIEYAIVIRYDVTRDPHDRDQHEIKQTVIATWGRRRVKEFGKLDNRIDEMVWDYNGGRDADYPLYWPFPAYHKTVAERRSTGNAYMMSPRPKEEGWQ